MVVRSCYFGPVRPVRCGTRRLPPSHAAAPASEGSRAGGRWYPSTAARIPGARPADGTADVVFVAGDVAERRFQPGGLRPDWSSCAAAPARRPGSRSPSWLREPGDVGGGLLVGRRSRQTARLPSPRRRPPCAPPRHGPTSRGRPEPGVFHAASSGPVINAVTRSRGVLIDAGRPSARISGRHPDHILWLLTRRTLIVRVVGVGVAEPSRGFALAVFVVPAPPFVGRALRIALRRVLPGLLTPQRGHVEEAPGVDERLVAAIVDEVGAEHPVAVADERVGAVPFVHAEVDVEGSPARRE